MKLKRLISIHYDSNTSNTTVFPYLPMDILLFKILHTSSPSANGPCRCPSREQSLQVRLWRTKILSWFHWHHQGYVISIINVINCKSICLQCTSMEEAAVVFTGGFFVGTSRITITSDQKRDTALQFIN